MNALNSYSTVYNLGHKVLADLFEDDIIAEEKIDGSQFSFGLIEGLLHCRSKGSKIVMEAPEKMFLEGVEYIVSIAPQLHEGWVYRGEYLKKPKHNVLAYDRIPQNHIIIFDIDKGGCNYLPHFEKIQEAKRLGLECVPLLYQDEISNVEEFEKLLATDSCLGGQKIEGVVIKNYNRFAPDKKTLMGKHVSEKYREIHNKHWKADKQTGKSITMDIGLALKTPARWQKAVQHLRDSGELTDSPKDIGALFKEVHADVLKECQEEIKEKLFKWAWKGIGRTITQGLAEWYKDELVKKQFESTEDNKNDKSKSLQTD